MLKLNYTETGLYMERLATSLEEFVVNRTILSLRAGQPIYVTVSTAAFLLPVDIADWANIADAIADDDITWASVDSKYAEISMSGTWMASDARAEEGTLVVALSDRAESYLYGSWQLCTAQLTSCA